MAYVLNLFSPETWPAFLNGSRSVSGFRERQYGIARDRVHVGDVFLCYLTGLSRWCGVLEVTSEAYRGESLYTEGDPYVIQFSVRPLICLTPELSVPIHQEDVWSTLSFTRDVEPNSSRWTGILRGSLNLLTPQDGEFLRTRLEHQALEQRRFPFSERDNQRLAALSSRRRIDIPTIPLVRTLEEPPSSEFGQVEDPEQSLPTRESILVQARLAEIGATMGFSVWIPNSDRSRVLEHLPESMRGSFRERLNLAYNDATLNTIRQIDVLWLREDEIIRAFEVEHTTAIYSGILRMTDLLALQSNIDIKLHIVAPDTRERKVLEEIRRPTFRRLGLTSKCSFLSYAKIDEILALPNLEHTVHSVLSNYEVWA